MQATKTDDRRRLVMPPELPAHSPVTIQQLDQDTFIVRRQHPREQLMVVLEPDVRDLPEDPKADKDAQALARHAWGKLPVPKF
jgi:hypothetical protein